MHWLSSLWFNYFWPSLKGNGPEAAVQTVLYATLAVVLIPPVRHFFKRHFESVHAKLDAHHKERTEQAERHHKAAMALARQHHFEHISALKPAANGRDAHGRFVKRGLKK